MKYDLSILIPARHEQWLARTVHDILEHKQGATEIIIGLDGEWANPPIEDHQDVRIVYYPESIGQRAMTNQLCRLSQAKYVAKVDAHCAFDEGFDVKMLEAFQRTGDNVIMVPVMRNLHVFNWICPDGHRRYQSPSGPCRECGKPTAQELIWDPKSNPQNMSYSFDSEPHFQYFNEYRRRPEYIKDMNETGLTETMSLQGSFFMITREKYWELNICDESFGSWGSQGIETACKMWLSGGRVLCNHKTWYAHLFRTQGGDFGFPYHQSGKQIEHAKQYARNLFFENRLGKSIHPLSWLIEKFWPITPGKKNKGWTYEELRKLKEFEGVPMEKGPVPLKGIIFYTDNQLNLKLAHRIQKQLRQISADKNIPIVSSSLKPMDNMGKNIHLHLQRGVLTMYKQILAALEASDADIIFHCEHDVLYAPEHFDFTPPTKDKFYYNQNFIKIWPDGFAAHWDANQVSGLVAYRTHLLEYYRARVKEIEEHGNDRSYEPGGRDENQYDTWKSGRPNIDVRHSNNITKSHRSESEFRDKSTCVGWTEYDIIDIPGWGDLTYLFR